MTKPDTKKIKRRILTAAILALPSVVLAAGPPAAEVKPKAPASTQAKPGAAPAKVSLVNGALLRSVLDDFSWYDRNSHSASPFEPPGRPGDRPPGSPPGHDNPPNPPGRPGDRPPNNGNGHGHGNGHR